MENYELFIDTPPKRQHGRFCKGNIPFNKGLPMKKWMDGRKIKKVLKCLEIGRKTGNPELPDSNKISIVAIKDGKLIAFRSSVDAAKILKAKGIKISAENIRAVCADKPINYNGRQYIRKYAGGFRWFKAENTEKYSELISENIL